MREHDAFGEARGTAGVLHIADVMDAVSYTHLDVYKRQILPFFVRIYVISVTSFWFGLSERNSLFRIFS